MVDLGPRIHALPSKTTRGLYPPTRSTNRTITASPPARFDALVASLLCHVKDVRLNGLGETPLVPDLHAYLDRLDPLSCLLELISNGTGACDVYERLFARGATVLISWDVATPAAFEKVRRPARWDEMRAAPTHRRGTGGASCADCRDSSEKSLWNLTRL